MQSRSPKITIKIGGKRPDELPPPTVNNHQLKETDQNANAGLNDQNALEGSSVPSNGDIKETDQNAVNNHQLKETDQNANAGLNDQNALEGSSVPSNGDIKETDQNAVAVSLSESGTDEDEDKDDDSHKQMVLYHPPMNDSDLIKTPKTPKLRSASRGPPEVGAFTVQCANCSKWRLIPDIEKYEVIREHITDRPFLCETTRQWGRDITCDDPTDIEQDGTRIWAIDKPNIAQPPPGWKRLLRLRKEGSSKFADVYYTSPTGAKLRSLPDVENFLKLNPEYAHGVGLARFSFQIPKPLGEDYVRKRPSRAAEPRPVEPIAWTGPAGNMELQIVEPLSWAGPMENGNGSVSTAAKKAKTEDIGVS